MCATRKYRPQLPGTCECKLYGFHIRSGQEIGRETWKGFAHHDTQITYVPMIPQALLVCIDLCLALLRRRGQYTNKFGKEHHWRWGTTGEGAGCDCVSRNSGWPATICKCVAGRHEWTRAHASVSRAVCVRALVHDNRGTHKSYVNLHVSTTNKHKDASLRRINGKQWPWAE